MFFFFKKFFNDKNENFFVLQKNLVWLFLEENLLKYIFINNSLNKLYLFFLKSLIFYLINGIFCLDCIIYYIINYKYCSVGK